MRIYIAGAITNLCPIETAKKFDSAEQFLRFLGYEPVNPMRLPHNHNRTWESYMRECIKALCDCDAIYILSDWEISAGATIERDLAIKLKMKIIYQK